MTRMYDLLRRHGGVSLSLPDDEMVLGMFRDFAVDRAPVYDVSNVWQYADAKMGPSASVDAFDWRRDFPVVTPPHERSWWEWRVGRSPSDRTFRPDAVGCAVEVHDLWAEEAHADRCPDVIRDAIRERKEVFDYENADRLTHVGAPLDVWNEVVFDTVAGRLSAPYLRDLLRQFDDPFRWIVSLGATFEESGDVTGPQCVFMFPISPDGALLEHWGPYCGPTHADQVAQIRSFGTLTDTNKTMGRVPLPFIAAGRLTHYGVKNYGLPTYRPQQGQNMVIVEGGEARQWIQADDSGPLLGDIDAVRGGRRRTVRPGDEEYGAMLVESQAIYDRVYDQRILTAAATTLYPLLQALAFTHLRNVNVVTVDPPAKLSRKHERKHGKALVRYQVVEIVPLRQALQVRRRSTSGGEPTPVSLHIRPGNFAHYGDCCPGVHDAHGLLFGKWEGKFWIPPHVRGKREVGEVITDYNVEKPAEEAS